MAGVNRVFLIGNLGQDPDVKLTTTGKTIAKFSLATSETWKDAAGVKQERTEWHQVTFFDRLGEVVAQYLKKGSKVFVSGSLRTEKYTDKNGIERQLTKVMGQELQMLDTKPKGEAGSAEWVKPEPGKLLNFEEVNAYFNQDMPF